MKIFVILTVLASVGAFDLSAFVEDPFDSPRSLFWDIFVGLMEKPDFVKAIPPEVVAKLAMNEEILKIALNTPVESDAQDAGDADRKQFVKNSIQLAYDLFGSMKDIIKFLKVSGGGESNVLQTFLREFLGGDIKSRGRRAITDTSVAGSTKLEVPESEDNGAYELSPLIAHLIQSTTPTSTEEIPTTETPADNSTDSTTLSGEETTVTSAELRTSRSLIPDVDF